MRNPMIIDLSHWQPDPIDWPTVLAKGTLGVIHKATEGQTYVDDKCFSRAFDAMGAGLCWATYHFLRPGDMQAQMQHYLNTVEPVHGERMCLDHEDSDVSLDDLKACIDYLLNDHRDLKVTLYSGHLIEEQLGGQRDDYLATHVDLWTPEYDNLPDVDWNMETWPVPRIWQYTDAAKVQGIGGVVDGNLWVGTREELRQWFGPNAPSIAASETA